MPANSQKLKSIKKINERKLATISTTQTGELRLENEKWQKRKKKKKKNSRK